MALAVAGNMNMCLLLEGKSKALHKISKMVLFQNLIQAPRQLQWKTVEYLLK